MARTRTLSELRDEVRQRADIEAATTAFPDSELTRYINQSIARLHRKVHRQFPDLFVAQTTITTVSGQETYSLPADFYALVGRPEVDLGGPGPQQMRRWEWPERVSYQYTSGWAWNLPVAYRLHGADTISFLPIPGGAHGVTVYYSPIPTDLSADGDTYDGRAGWEEWVILDAAIKVATKEEQDASTLVAERAEHWEDITSDLGMVDRGGPPRVQDKNRRATWMWDF